jgi:hypothetical protein
VLRCRCARGLCGINPPLRCVSFPVVTSCHGIPADAAVPLPIQQIKRKLLRQPGAVTLHLAKRAMRSNQQRRWTRFTTLSLLQTLHARTAFQRSALEVLLPLSSHLERHGYTRAGPAERCGCALFRVVCYCTYRYSAVSTCIAHLNHILCKTF